MNDPLPVTLFDYGAGNLHSIHKALERSGAEVSITRDVRDLLDAPVVVLPGVGAFGACMDPLADEREALRDHLLSGVPCLAVCIGMQLLFESSEEDPGVEGVGLFRGAVRRFPASAGKIPHMGWNQLHGPMRLAPWDARSGVGMRWRDMLPGAGADVYYVHSYYAAPDEPITLLSSTYGLEYAAVVARGNTIATQFHPEKSSALGLAIIDGWVAAARRHLGQKGQEGKD